MIVVDKKKLSTTTMRIDIPLDTPEEESKKKVIRIHSRRTSARDGSRDVIKVSKSAASVNRYNALLQSIYDAVIITDRNGNISDWNIRALQFFGYEADEMRKISIVDLISGADETLLAMISGNLEEERFTIIDAFCSQKSGKVFSAEIAVNRIFISDEGELCFFIRDVTVRREMEDDIRRANKIKSLHMLAGGVAHDFNNLLTSVIGNTELALSGIPANSNARDDLSVALQDAKKMALLSHRMLAYSGKGFLQNAYVNINLVVADAVNEFSVRTPGNIDMKTQLADWPVMVGGEGDILESMLENLLINAVEAIGRTDGQITLSTSLTDIDEDYIHQQGLESEVEPGRYACLMIQDTGYGMDDVIVEKIFDPYFSTKGAGRGLGLSEVQGIVVAHGGAIVVDTAIGRGSTFKVMLPVNNGQNVQEAEKAELSHADVAGTSILIVDDEPSIRRYAQRILEKQGFGTFTACDGESGISQFREHADEIDLVILDMFMPKLNGDEVLKEIRKIRPGMKVLIASGYTDSVYSDRFTNEKPTGYLFKPFATSDFMEKITEALQS